MNIDLSDLDIRVLTGLVEEGYYGTSEGARKAYLKRLWTRLRDVLEPADMENKAMQPVAAEVWAAGNLPVKPESGVTYKEENY